MADDSGKGALEIEPTPLARARRRMAELAVRAAGGTVRDGPKAARVGAGRKGVTDATKPHHG